MKQYQIVVIGAGAAGLVVAIGGVKAGKKVLLIEKGEWGGDCTNFGCVPSKSLIASAEAAYAGKKAQELGLDGGSIFNRNAKAMDRVHSIVSQVRVHEEPVALQEKDVETLAGVARFLDPNQLNVNDEVILGDQVVIATGSSPIIPAIEGLANTPYLTNETIFDLKQIPNRLCVIGGGPIGCELAQAFSRLGSHVTQIHRRGQLLKKEEPEASDVIVKQFREEGIEVFLEYSPQKVSYEDEVFTIVFSSEKEEKTLKADALLVAVGRKPNIELLNLNAAKVKYSAKGILVDKYGRTSQKHIWAIGDVIGGAQFTHAAENQARTVLTSLILPWKKKMSKQAIPRTTYTDPEVASFGYLKKEAEEAYGQQNINVYDVPMKENDRAITTSRTEGFVRVVTKKTSSKILGATIVAPRAGEMLPELSLAAKEKIPLRKIASLIHPYPTYSLAVRRAADQWLTQVFLPWLQHPAKWLPWKRLIPLFIIVVLMIVAYAAGLHKYVTFNMLRERHQTMKLFVEAHPILTPILYTLIYTVSTSLSLPGGAILSLIGGFLFPIPWSTLYVLIGATIGASVIFLAARTAFGDFFRKKAGPALRKMEKGFQENAWSYLLFLRFVPLFPFWLVNVAPALFNVSLMTFMWTTLVGIIPGAYVYTQTGAGLGAIFETGKGFSLDAIFNIQLRIALIALGIFALVPIIIKKWLAKRKKSKN